MSNIFAASEIVELAIEIEKNGREFYYALIRKSKFPKAQEIFQHLAIEEGRHILAFKKILDIVQRYNPESLSGEYLAYMSSLADGYIFTQKNTGEAAVLKVQTDLQGIELGIGFEMDSVAFYEGMKKAVPDNEHKIIDEIITQEGGHLKQLLDLKKGLR